MVVNPVGFKTFQGKRRKAVALLCFMLSSAIIASMILGIVIGSLVGLFLSFLLIEIPLAFLGVTTEIVWSRLPVFLVLPVPLIVGIILLSFVSAFVTTYIVTKRGLSSNLADDFRHIE
ncbi:MAG: hypothetical protein RTS72_01955 [Candidatus Thorarchaeota archaeon]